MIVCILTIGYIYFGVNAQYSGTNMAKNTLTISPYKIFLNDSNGRGCYFLKY
jgi:hypothetical protein